MKILNLSILALTLSLGDSLFASERLVIELVEPEKFTDFSVQGMDENRTAYIFDSELKRFINLEITRLLPNGVSVRLEVTDIDMAGDIQPWRNRNHADIRYVEQIYPPRMSFRYVIENEGGVVLATGETRIRDMNFMFGLNTRFRTYNSFQYEFSMLADWLRRDVPKLIEASEIDEDKV
jgi:hypothetical protein